MWQALRKLIAANPMGVFLWGLITKWYIMIAVASLLVVFWVVKGLEKIGFTDYMYKSATEILDTTKGAAQNCIPKLGKEYKNLVDFWNCLGNPGPYRVEGTEEEKKGQMELEQDLKKILPKDGTVPEMLPFKNPYDSPDNPPNDSPPNNSSNGKS